MDDAPQQHSMLNELRVLRQAGRQAVGQFLQSYNCLSILKTSTKVVVFDVRIPIQLAFYALVEHDMLCAPLWDSVKCQFVGLVTVTDFIDLLLLYRTIGKDVTTLANDSIAEIIAFLQQKYAKNDDIDDDDDTAPHPISLLRSFQGAATSCSLYQACLQLLTSQQDFLPIVFTADMRVLSCITYTTILEHLVTHFREQRRLFDDSVSDLNIGTYGEAVVKVTTQQTLAEALQLMAQHRLSALPVIDATTHKVVAMYSRSDITFLTRALDAEDAVRNLDLPLREILQATAGITTPDALRTCAPTHTLQAIFESFAMQRFHRLCVVDAEERLLGIVSAKDLVAYFLQDAVRPWAGKDASVMTNPQ